MKMEWNSVQDRKIAQVKTRLACSGNHEMASVSEAT